MSQRFRASILCADSKPCRSPRNTTRAFAAAKWFFEALAVNHFRCQKKTMLYLLGRSRRPRLFRPARFEKRGGRANRRRCARWRRFPSDCQSKPHSDVGNAVLCRNFSRRGHPCPARFEQERYETDPPASARRSTRTRRAEETARASEQFQASGTAV